MSAALLAAPAQPASAGELKDRATLAVLDPSERQHLPLLEVVPVLGLDRRATILFVELALLDLRYYLRPPQGAINADLTDAIRAYQGDLGHEPTGTLLLSQFQELARRMAQLHPVPVYPAAFELSSDSGTLVARGTWDGTADGSLRTTEIRCWKASLTCLEATAILEPTHGEERADQLVAQSAKWRVTVWSDRELEAKREERCEIEKLHVHFATSSVVVVNETYGATPCRERSPVVTQRRLVDGQELGRTAFQRRWEAANRAYSSAFAVSLAPPSARSAGSPPAPSTPKRRAAAPPAAVSAPPVRVEVRAAEPESPPAPPTSKRRAAALPAAVSAPPVRVEVRAAEPESPPAPPISKRRAAAPPPAERALTVFVNVNATPWAEIEIDGQLAGETPLGRLPIVEGRHRFVAHFPDGRVEEQIIDIRPQRRHVIFRLRSGEASQDRAAPPERRGLP